MIMFTDILQGNDTVVLVGCISEWEPDITCNREGKDTNVTAVLIQWMCTGDLMERTKFSTGKHAKEEKQYSAQ